MSHTIDPIIIDNMGADPDVEWIVHVPLVVIRSEPDFTSPIIGQLTIGSACRGVPVHERTSDTEWLRLGSTGFISLTQLHRIHPANAVEGAGIRIGTEAVNRWWGLPADYEPTDLVDIPSAYHMGREDRRYLLRTAAVESLVAMLAEARNHGIDIRAGSTYRSWTYQKGLFDRAVEKDGPSQRYSAPPGHSEHQLGTAADLTDVGGRHFIEESFGDTPHYRWLVEHAAAYGWRQSYTVDNIPQTGYICEPWHWRYHGEP
ncbi:hypothetical protein GC173_02580 [bacterium]|nr:hypothetical protein [bacterium]